MNRTTGTDNRTTGTDNRTTGTDNRTKGTDNRTTGTDNRTTGTDNRTTGTDIRAKKGAVVGGRQSTARLAPTRGSILLCGLDFARADVFCE